MADDADSNLKSTDPAFELRELRVLGNTVLPAQAIEATIYPFLGPVRTFKDVEAARAALETVYHDRGYGTVFVDIPEQSVEVDGVVRLRVMEGRISKTSVTGARYFSGRQIRAVLPSAQKDGVPHLPTLQSELAQVNAESSDRVVTPILKAGPTPGTVDLALRVDDHLPFHGSIELNNQYTTDTEPLRAAASLSYDNLFGRLDSVSLQYQTAPQNRRQVDVLTANYVAKFEHSKLALYMLHSNSNVATFSAASSTTSGAASSDTSAGPSELLILGKGDVYGVRFIVPLVNTAEATHNFTLGAEYKDFLSSIDSDPNLQKTYKPGEPHASLDTPITYVNLSSGYGGFWRGTRYQASFETNLNFGVRGLVNDTTEFENKRYRARPNYFYLRSSGSYGEHLPGDFTLVFRAAGQYAREPIISDEQFSIAGADGVRGYLEAEELADTAIKASLQFGSPQWKWFGDRLRTDAFIFYDYGKIGVIDPLPGEPSTTALRSWGAGVNLVVVDHLTGALTWARALTDGSHTTASESRFLFGIRGWW